MFRKIYYLGTLHCIKLYFIYSILYGILCRMYLFLNDGILCHKTPYLFKHFDTCAFLVTQLHCTRTIIAHNVLQHSQNVSLSPVGIIQFFLNARRVRIIYNMFMYTLHGRHLIGLSAKTLVRTHMQHCGVTR